MVRDCEYENCTKPFQFFTLSLSGLLSVYNIGMRTLLKNCMLFLMMMTMLLGPSFSSEKVDDLLEEDSLHELDIIQDQLDKLNQFQLKKIEFYVAKRAKGERVYLKFERVLGAVVLAGVVAGSATIYFPPGMRVLISANILVRGMKSGTLVLSESDANIILNDLKVLKLKLESSKKTLLKTSRYYCKLVASHDICN